MSFCWKFRIIIQDFYPELHDIFASLFLWLIKALSFQVWLLLQFCAFIIAVHGSEILSF